MLGNNIISTSLGHVKLVVILLALTIHLEILLMPEVVLLTLLLVITRLCIIMHMSTAVGNLLLVPPDLTLNSGVLEVVVPLLAVVLSVSLVVQALTLECQ
jgi:hypothetical protein